MPWVRTPDILVFLGHDRALLRHLTGLLKEESARRLPLLRTALGAGDGPLAAREAHGIKSGLTNFCAPGAVELATQVELACRSGRLGTASMGVERLDQCIADVLVELEQLGRTG